MYLAKDIDFFYSYDTGEGVEGLSMLAYRRRSKVVWFNEKDNFYRIFSYILRSWPIV